VVPEFPLFPAPPLFPPAQLIVPRDKITRSTPSIAGQLRRLRGTPISSTRANAVPAEGQSSFFDGIPALDAAVVNIVSVELCAPVPVIVSELGDRLHAAGSLTATGLIEQVRFTVPVKPLEGATVMVAVLPVVAPGKMVIDELPPPIVKVGSGVTARAMVVDAVNAPEVPVMVTVPGPATVAVLLAVSVSTWVPVTVPEAKLAVTPLGSPEAARVMLPLNPPTSVTEIVLVPIAACAMDNVLGDAESVKPGAMLTVSAMVVDAVSVPEVPVMVTVTGPPTVALLLAISVSTLVPVVVELGLKLAVTPVGSPVALRVTPPVNPLAGVTVMVSVLLLP
jgi:hypothetical protein